MAFPGRLRRRSSPNPTADANVGAPHEPDAAPVAAEAPAVAAEAPPVTDPVLAERVRAIPVWFHSLDLGHGVVTPGVKSLALLDAELDRMRLPDLHGRSVLDIGAWDGYFSFAAERAGAERVVALDHYVWAMDLVAQQRYVLDCVQRGVAPESFEHVPSVWRPDELPGKRGFDLAREVYGSAVEARIGDFMAMDLTTVGAFDVVFFLGVLYHLQDPLSSLRRLREVTGGVAVIETEAMHVPSETARPLLEFFPDDELGGDPTNWWSPNEAGLHGLCRAAGFSRTETVIGPPVGAEHHSRYRAVVHAWA